MSRPVSRLERRERKKILRQTLVFAGVAAVIGILFIFLVLPNFIRILNALVGGGTGLASDDRLPPQVPILSAPPSATNSAGLAVAGYGEPESTVVFVLNGREIDRAEISEDGEFEVILKLSEGENSVAAYAIDTAGNESNASRSYLVVLDTQAPSLVFDELEHGMTIVGRQQQQLEIIGATEPNARVYLNGRMILANSEGVFQTGFFLQEGENTLQFRAEDQAGNSTEQEIKINFKR